MKQKQKLRLSLVIALFLVSFGGWLLHVRIHPPSKLDVHYIPFFAGLLGTSAVPTMFLFKRTAAYAYVLNGILVIIGTITMTHFSLAHPPEQVTFSTILSRTLLPDILILFTNFLLGKTLFELELLRSEDTLVRRGRFFRYPNTGWWFVHLFALSATYLGGHFLWK